MYIYIYSVYIYIHTHVSPRLLHQSIALHQSKGPGMGLL